jgi:two-component system sensor histidine kinase YesM
LNSIRTKLIRSFLFFAVPIVILLLFTNIYAVFLVRTQVSESYENMVALHLNQVDTALTDVEQYLSLAIYYEDSLQAIKKSQSDMSSNLARISLKNKLTNDILVYKTVDCFFAYLPEADTFLSVNKNSMEYEKRDQISIFVQNNADTDAIDFDSWKVYTIEDSHYLMRIIRSNNMYLGACIQMESLKTPMTLVDLGENIYTFFTDRSGSVLTPLKNLDLESIHEENSLIKLTQNGKKANYQFVSQSSSKGDFKLNVLIPEKNTLNYLPHILRFSFVILFVLCFIIIPAYLIFINKDILLPLKSLVASMKKVKNGDLKVRISLKTTSDEFEIVKETFNNMLIQIQDLQISVQHEKNTALKEELYRLQMQQSPHFLINSLNILYNLSGSKDYKLIEEMTLCMIRYYRFIYTNHFNFVLLKDEISHCEDYLRIQKMSMKDKLTYSFTVPDFLDDTPVPPLVVQTFLENAIKYSATEDGSVAISVNIDFSEYKQEDCIKIIVKDNGNGFPEDCLHMFNNTEKMFPQKKSEHMGIKNIQRRMALLYKGKSDIRISNSNGAKIEIYLPVSPDINIMRKLF